MSKNFKQQAIEGFDPDDFCFRGGVEIASWINEAFDFLNHGDEEGFIAQMAARGWTLREIKITETGRQA